MKLNCADCFIIILFLFWEWIFLLWFFLITSTILGIFLDEKHIFSPQNTILFNWSELSFFSPSVLPFFLPSFLSLNGARHVHLRVHVQAPCYPCYVKMRSREESCSGLLTLHSAPPQPGGSLFQGPPSKNHSHANVFFSCNHPPPPPLYRLLPPLFCTPPLWLIYRHKCKKKDFFSFLFFCLAPQEGEKQSIGQFSNMARCRRKKINNNLLIAFTVPEKKTLFEKISFKS